MAIERRANEEKASGRGVFERDGFRAHCGKDRGNER